MKRVLGLDLGTNSIGWALIEHHFENKEGQIKGLGSRIIPMSQDIMDNFGKGQSISQTAERTHYRSVRKLYQRDHLRRERLHRVLNILGFLPEHYAKNIDFEKHLGQFLKETKLNYKPLENGKYEFIFMNSFKEMLEEFKQKQPQLFHIKSNGKETPIPLDWTIYYLRKKALSKKITKEELAWILLNFNQKRGYYQLRGEEEEIENNKQKTFEVLKVAEVKDSGDVIKGKNIQLFDIYFENGWKYDKQTTKPEDWLHKTKEFIVTTSSLKDGSIKRSFKTVDSEKDWIAIKQKTEQDISASNQTVGEYIYETLLKQPTQKIRGKLIKTIERKFYKKELQAILKTQIKLQADLFSDELYQKCLEELYPKNEAHKNNIKDKGFEYLLLNDIIFYQRPLKSKKSTISGCQYEKQIYFIKDSETGEKIWKEKALKVIPKSHPLFLEFRMWQFLCNLKIYHKQNKSNIDITSNCFQNNEEWCDLFDFLMSKKEIEQKQIIDYLVSLNKIEKTKKEEYRWNFQEDKKLPMNETKAQFISRFKKVNGFDLKQLSPEFQIRLWHIIYSVKDKNEFEQALKTFANKNNIDEASFVKAFKSFPPYKSEYGSYSEKAIKKLLPLMRKGRYWDEQAITKDVKLRIEDIKARLNSINYEQEVFEKDQQNRLQSIVDDAIPKALLKSFISFKDTNHLEGLNTYQACYAVYERHSEVGDIVVWETSKELREYIQNFQQHSLRNPIVEQVTLETLRVTLDIWEHYAPKYHIESFTYFDEKSNKERTAYHRIFDEIHVELGRDIKNSAEIRKNISNKNTEKERTNLRIKELLKELKSEYTDVDIRPYSPSHQELLKIYEEGIVQNPNVSYKKVSEDDILKIRKKNSPTKKEIEKYKLWLEQGYVSPYTGQIIPLGQLFTEAYQIEHIIPQSRYFDDSLYNKVICESAVNQDKSNKTAYEYLKEKGGSIINLGNENNVPLLHLDVYEKHCEQYFKNNPKKLNNLLSEGIPEGFINRQMTDSRYISKFVKNILSNVVREASEKEATSKHLLPTPGAITNKLKQNWGLNDKWNELIAPRFKRLNELTNSQDYGYWDKEINTFRTLVPDEVNKNGFSKKRIDHRHHALDALIIACTTKEHTNYLNSLEAEKENHSLKEKLLVKNEHKHYTKNFKLPWNTFPIEAKEALDKTVVSFKKNTRVINKTNNKTWQWVKQDNGSYKKELVKQTKGKNWAIRKALHKETVSGLVNIKRIKKGLSSLNSFLDKPELIVDKRIKSKVRSLHNLFDKDLKKIRKHLKSNPIQIDGQDISKIQVYEWTKNATASRIVLTEKFTRKQLEAVTDSGIQAILENHIKNYIDEKGNEQFDLAFNTEGVEELNRNIVILNNGKKHQPIYKVRIYEEGSKFNVSETKTSQKSTKYVEAAKGTNLFFAIYWDEEKKKRNYETIPLNEVIQHQKDVANLPKEERTPIPTKAELGQFIFSLSPNDLVYVPTEEEQANPNLVDFKNLTKEQVDRIYKMVSSSTSQCFFIKEHVSIPIANKIEFSTSNKMERDLHNNMIKDICWKLKVDRLGNIIGIIK